MADPFFSAKISLAKDFFWFWRSGQQFFLILKVFFIILLCLILFLFFWWWLKVKDNLINLVPVDSLLYVTAHQPNWPTFIFVRDWQKMKIENLPFAEFYQQTSQKEIFAKLNFNHDLLANSRQAAVALIPADNFALTPVFIFQFKKATALLPILTKLNHYLLLPKNILVVSDNQFLLEKVQSVADGQIFSLAAKFNFWQHQPGLINFYFAADNLKNYLLSSNNSLAPFFNALIKKDIYLNLNYKKNHWQLALTNGFFASPATTNQTAVDYLPTNFSFYSHHLNLAEVFSDWLQADNDVNNFFVQTTETLKTVYNFDLASWWPSFFTGLADLIIFEQNQKSVFGFNYLLVMPAPRPSVVADLEKIIKIILAQNLPTEVAYQLPDGTSAVELVAQPDQWQWQKEVLVNTTLHYLEEPQLNFTLAYSLVNDQLIIANSPQLLKDFFVSQDIDIKDLVKQCWSSRKQNQFLLFNNKNLPLLFKSYLPNGFTLIRQLPVSTKTVGCLL